MIASLPLKGKLYINENWKSLDHYRPHDTGLARCLCNAIVLHQGVV